MLLPILALPLLLAGCGISGATYANADKYKVGNAEFESSQIHSVDVSWASGDVDIVYHDDDTVLISEETSRELSESEMMHYYLDGDKLMIKYNASGIRVFSLRETLSHPFTDNYKNLTITLPEDMRLDSVDLEVASATVNTPALNADKIGVDSASGAVTLGVKDASDVHIKSASGSITLGTNNASNISIDTASGKVDLTSEGKTEKITLSSSSGEMKASLNGEVGELSTDSASGSVAINASKLKKLIVSSASGRIDGTFDEAPEEMTVDTASGSIIMTLPENAEFTVKKDTASGKFRCDFPITYESDDTFTCGSGTAEYSFETASGDITILKG